MNLRKLKILNKKKFLILIYLIPQQIKIIIKNHECYHKNLLIIWKENYLGKNRLDNKYKYF